MVETELMTDLQFKAAMHSTYEIFAGVTEKIIRNNADKEKAYEEFMKFLRNWCIDKTGSLPLTVEEPTK